MSSISSLDLLRRDASRADKMARNELIIRDHFAKIGALSLAWQAHRRYKDQMHLWGKCTRRLNDLRAH